MNTRPKFNGKRGVGKGIEEPRINNEIRIPLEAEVRVVHSSRTDNSGFSELMSFAQAIRLSEKMELDLIEINSQVRPTVLKLDSYDKYLWELKKAAKQKNKKPSSVKEIQLSANISPHDLETKAKKAKEFIEDGDRVKVVLRLKGRELGRREFSKGSLRDFIELMSGVAVVDGQIREEGRNSVVILKRK